MASPGGEECRRSRYFFNSHVLGASEDEGFVVPLLVDLVEQLRHAVKLLPVLDHVHYLQNVLVCGQLLRADFYLEKVLLGVPGESLHFFGPRGVPQQGLSVGTHLGDDGADLGLEARATAPGRWERAAGRGVRGIGVNCPNMREDSSKQFHQ